MKKNLRSATEMLNILAGVIKGIPTIPKENKTMRNIRKIYSNLTTVTKFKQKEKKFTKDKTKFKLDGKILGKGKLALAVITKRASEGRLTFAQLQNEFPDNLTGKFNIALGLVRQAKDVKYRDRYFMDNIIKTSDGKKVVVSSQFGIKNIGPIVDKARSLGYAVETIVK